MLLFLCFAIITPSFSPAFDESYVYQFGNYSVPAFYFPSIQALFNEFSHEFMVIPNAVSSASPRSSTLLTLSTVGSLDKQYRKSAALVEIFLFTQDRKLVDLGHNFIQVLSHTRDGISSEEKFRENFVRFLDKSLEEITKYMPGIESLKGTFSLKFPSHF